MEILKKNKLMIGLIYVVIFVAYNLTVFLTFSNYNAVFFVSYGFMISAFLIHIGCIFFILRNVSVKTIFFGIPLMSFSIYFVCAEFFCSLVLMVFRERVSVKTAVLIQALLICLFLVIAIISIMTRDMVQDVDAKIKESTAFTKDINVDVEMLIERCSDAETIEALKKLSETIKYSDPMFNKAVAAQEQMILQYMIELKNIFDSNDIEKTKELCRKIELLFIERNKKLIVSK